MTDLVADDATDESAGKHSADLSAALRVARYD
jgi:hypothetical protein